MATDDNKPSNTVDGIKDASPTSVNVNSEPVREDQVQNAVKFLLHPKVRGSAVVYRRSFLERKGLTKEEIDEAFRRVPDPPPSVTGVQSSSTDVQPQSSNHIQQPPVPAPATTVAVGTLNKSRFNLRQALLTVGILSASGAGAAILFKNIIIPRLKSWIRKVALEEDENLVKKLSPKPTLVDEAGAAAKAAANAAVDVARATQEMMSSKAEERKFFNELQNMLDLQVKEMKSMSNAIKNLEGQISTHNTIPSTDSKQYGRANGKVDFDLQAAKYESYSAQVESSLTPHQKSYMEEIMEMIQNGENPNIKDINGQMLNPYQQPLTNSQTTLPKMADEFGSDQKGEKDSNDDPLPWWQKKVNKTDNVYYSPSSLSSSTFQTNERQIQRSSWVPPQPPPVAMAEAAAAIRHHKTQKQAVVDEGTVGASSSANGIGDSSPEMNTIKA